MLSFKINVLDLTFFFLLTLYKILMNTKQNKHNSLLLSAPI